MGFMKINEKIKRLREGKHWSQEEMAQKLNMSKNGYAKIERGETSASLGRLEQVAAVLGIGLCELLADVCGGALHDGCNADDARGSAENVLLLQQARQIIELKDEIIANKEQLIAARNRMAEREDCALAVVRQAKKQPALGYFFERQWVMTMMVACPICRTPVEWCRENRYRPFCSERCKLVDLGEWADESRAIPAAPETPEDWDALYHE